MIKNQIVITCFISSVCYSAAYYSYWNPINCDENGYGCEYSSLDNTSTTNSFDTYDYYKSSAKDNYHTNEARGFSDSTNDYSVITQTTGIKRHPLTTKL